jgi:hypothetical protein
MSTGIKYKFDPNQIETPAPTDPVAPSPAPVDPVAPVEPNPIEPTAPAAPIIPTGSVDPIDLVAPVAPVDPSPSMADADLLKALQARYGNEKISSLDDILRTQTMAADPVEPIVPKIMDSETEDWVRYNEETGRPLRDWISSKEDLSKTDPLSLAKDRIRNENAGVDLTEEEVNFLLEDKLGFDPSESELDPKEKALFKQFYGAQLKLKQEEQQKLSTPLDGHTQKSQPNAQPTNGGKVKLSNGMEVDEASYTQQRQQYLTERNQQIEGLVEEKFNLLIEGKDGKKEMALDYQFTPEDRRGMMSDTEDLGSLMNPFYDQEGKVKIADLSLAVWRGKKENFDRVLGIMASKIRSEVIAEMVGNRRNLSLDQPSAPPAPVLNQGYATVGGTQSQTGVGVKYPFQTKQ